MYNKYYVIIVMFRRKGLTNVNIQSRKINNIDVMTLYGRFDAYEVPAINEWLEDHPLTANMVINLSGVSFIDSSGLSVLVKTMKRCRQNGGELYLCNMQQPVKVIFELTHLDKAFKIFNDEKSAVQAFHK